MANKKRYVEIMDTTLRDGEQTEGVSIAPEEKLTIARLLLDKVKVDRIEVASARVSEGEQIAVAKITDWARSKGLLDRIECLGFVDETKSVDWLASAGCRAINLLTKGSLKHVTIQLNQSPEEHAKRIAETVAYARKKKFIVNVYLEDWSGGMLESKDYALYILDAVVRMGVDRVMLPDTLGILSPSQVFEFVRETIQRHPVQRFCFHGHNDYGLAAANSLAAVEAGAHAVHTTVNGLGERAGNAALDETVASLRDFGAVRLGVNEKHLKNVSSIVEVFSGQRIAGNKPICGEKVFTQTAGIHADGDKKGKLYQTRLSPDRFARDRTYALGKLSGRSNLEFNLRKIGIDLTPDQSKQVLQRIVQLGDMKKTPTTDDLPFIISDVLQVSENRLFEVRNCVVISSKGLRPVATVSIRYDGEDCVTSGTGDGGYDAFMSALRAIKGVFPNPIPALADYEVHIPPGGRTDALVEAIITWETGLKTRGVNSDQVMAAIDATERMMNIVQQPKAEKARSRKKTQPAERRAR